MYNLLTAQLLFAGKNHKDFIYKNKRCIFPNNYDRVTKGYSIEARQLLANLLNAKPDRRPTAAEALRHTWFAEISEGID